MSAQGLPAHILALFTPRPPPQHLPAQVDKRAVKLTGVADFVEYFSGTKPDKRASWESPKERKERRAKEKLKTHKEELKALTDKYDPHKDANASGDPFKTLFVARISYDTTEKKLKREFEVFGSIKRVRMIYDLKGKPRGYAFIEFEHERDLKNAYKQGDGKKIDGRRVMVDVERGRTVEGWLPRRLGGGRGPGRQGKPSKKKKNQAAAAASAEAGDKDTKEKEEKPERPHKDRGEKDRGEKDRGEKDRGEKDRGEKERGDKERATAAPAGGAEGRKERDKEKDRDRDRERKKDDKEEKRRDDKKKDKKEKVQKERSRSRDRDRDRDRDREHVKKKSRRED